MDWVERQHKRKLVVHSFGGPASLLSALYETWLKLLLNDALPVVRYQIDFSRAGKRRRSMPRPIKLGFSEEAPDASANGA